MKKASVPGYKLPYLYVRGGLYVYRRAIPARLRSLANGQREFKKTLQTKDIAEAIARYGPVDAEIRARLTRLRKGEPLSQPNVPDVSELRDITSVLGLSYKSMEEMAGEKGKFDLIQRVEQWDRLGRPEGGPFHALFGTAPNRTTMNDVLDFYKKHTEDRRIGLNQREIDKKLKPVQLAVRRFNEFAGEEADIKLIRRATAMNYRSHLVEQMKAGLMVANTVNKQLIHLRKIVSFYVEHNQLDVANPFSKVSVKEEQNARLPYSVKFIKENWLTGDPFAGLNGEARGILFAMIDTGCGGKEICGISPDEIVLDDKVPHIIIQPNDDRKLKTPHRGRKIPLVGNSLKAFQAHPEGFPRYRQSPGADTFSNTLMKYLKENSLLETPDHMIYGIRHTFMDRMRTHGFPDEMQNYLMGHKHPTMGSRYGQGYTLADKAKYMKKLGKDWK